MSLSSAIVSSYHPKTSQLDNEPSLKLPDENLLAAPGSSFYLIRDWQNQYFLLKEKEKMRMITGYSFTEKIYYSQYFKFIHDEDVEGFTMMERKWQKLIKAETIALARQFKINFDYRIKIHDKQYIRLLHQIIKLIPDESGVVRYSIERCTDISIWKRYGSMVLSVLGPPPLPPYHFRPHCLSREDPLSSLTKTEKKVVQLLTIGKSSKEIASDLDITFNTANTHRRNILRKTEAKNTAELVKYTLQYV